MSTQKFAATEKFQFSNGAIGWRPGGPFDCLGPYAKVQNCPIDGTDLRLTCYATGYADTYFSVPACTRYRGRYIGGFFTSAENSDSGSIRFVPYDRFIDRLPAPDNHAVIRNIDNLAWQVVMTNGRTAGFPISQFSLETVKQWCRDNGADSVEFLE